MIQVGISFDTLPFVNPFVTLFIDLICLFLWATWGVELWSAFWRLDFIWINWSYALGNIETPLHPRWCLLTLPTDSPFRWDTISRVKFALGAFILMRDSPATKNVGKPGSSRIWGWGSLEMMGTLSELSAWLFIAGSQGLGFADWVSRGPHRLAEQAQTHTGRLCEQKASTQTNEECTTILWNFISIHTDFKSMAHCDS